jgi:hypothetical protein
MIGTFIANPGANTMATGCTLEGRLLSTAGAVGISTARVTAPSGCGLPVLTGPTAPVLGEADCYALFSSSAGTAGVNNTGTSYLNGDVGTNLGTTTGFTTLFVTGTIHGNPDASTISCAADLTTALSYLDGLNEDIQLLFPAIFGNKQVLTPHTYLMSAATILTDTLFLDAQGNSSAVFVFQINGTFSTLVNSVVMLQNGAQAANVYWKVDGAVTLAAGSIMKGTIIVDAASINSACDLEGKLLTTSGTVLVNSTSVSKATNCFAPITPYLGPAPDMGEMADFVLFTSNGMITNTPSSQITGDIGTNV